VQQPRRSLRGFFVEGLTTGCQRSVKTVRAARVTGLRIYIRIDLEPVTTWALTCMPGRTGRRFDPEPMVWPGKARVALK
jgi:hypothetical protein